MIIIIINRLDVGPAEVLHRLAEDPVGAAAALQGHRDLSLGSSGMWCFRMWGFKLLWFEN